MAFHECKPCDFPVDAELEGKRICILAYALARRLGAPDCQKVELHYIYLLMNINGLALAQ